jgi:DNA-binding Lrp family transcriptional regulator
MISTSSLHTKINRLSPVKKRIAELLLRDSERTNAWKTSQIIAHVLHMKTTSVTPAMTELRNEGIIKSRRLYPRKTQLTHKLIDTEGGMTQELDLDDLNIPQLKRRRRRTKSGHTQKIHDTIAALREQQKTIEMRINGLELALEIME